MALPMRYNLLSALARPASTISSVLLVAVIIATFAYLQAVTDSAFNTMVGTGDPNTIIVLTQGADTETVSGIGRDRINKLESTPLVARYDTTPIISSEVVAISSAFTKEDETVAVNTSVRGVVFDTANKVRRGRVRLLQGRTFSPGKYEVIVGQSAHRRYKSLGIGDQIQLGTRGMRMFDVVGIFDTGGTSSDSEVWGYVETLRDVYGRTGYSSARLLFHNDIAAQAAIEFIEGPGIEMTAKTEREYYSTISTNQNATQVLGVVMVVVMGIAAVFAIANTMYATVAGRTSEIATLRAIGFSRPSILTAFVVEGIFISLTGGVAGSLISCAFNGLQHDVLPTTFTTMSYSLSITPRIIFASLVMAVAIGFFGSLMPAYRAARLSVTQSLRDN